LDLPGLVEAGDRVHHRGLDAVLPDGVGQGSKEGGKLLPELGVGGGVDEEDVPLRLPVVYAHGLGPSPERRGDEGGR